MKSVVIIFAFFISFHLISRAQEADSIYASLNQKPVDFLKIKELAAASNSLASSNPLEAVKLARYIIGLSVEINSVEGKAVGYNELGNAFERHSIYDSAFYYFLISHRLFSEINNLSGMANTLINIGNVHEIKGNFDSAAYYAFQALTFIDSTGDPNLKAKNLRVVGNIMHKKNKPKDAIQNYLAALDLLKIQDNLPGLKGRVYENLALSYIKLSNYNAAENYFAEAGKMYDVTKDSRDVARLNLNIASLREFQGKYDEALKRTQFALKFFRKINHLTGIAESLITLCGIYYKMQKYDDAFNYALQSIAVVKQSKDLDIEMQAYAILQKISFERNDYKKAYQYQTAASMLRDSIFSDKKEAIITELQKRFENEKKETEITLLNKDNEIKALTIKKQAIIRDSLIAGTILIIVISVLLFNRYRISEKQKHHSERKRISSDLHDDIGSGLSKINLLSHVLKQHIKDTQSAIELEKISDVATDALEKMSEMVWSLNPKNDKLENLVAYVRKYAVEYFESTTIVFNVHMPGEIPSKMISGEQRRNVFLTIKEALHNIIKHSDATKVDLFFVNANGRTVITIHDNGKGINSGQVNEFGNGLLNMKQRMEEAGGDFSIESSEGTTIRLELNLS